MNRDDSTEFETLKDVIASGRKRDGTALDIANRPAPYSYHEFCTNIWKAGNLLGHYGVHVVGEVAVLIGPKSSDSTGGKAGSIDAAEPLLAVLGGVILGSTVDLTPSEPVDGPVLVAPAHQHLDVTPSCSRLAYGGPPTDPEISHFERAVWSENPVEPPEQVEPNQEALRFEDETWTHAELLEVAGELVARHEISPNSRVVLDAPLTEPGGFVAGILAPLIAGGAIVVPERQTGDANHSLEERAVANDAHSIVVTQKQNSDAKVAAADVTRSMRDIRRV